MIIVAPNAGNARGWRLLPAAVMLCLVLSGAAASERLRLAAASIEGPAGTRAQTVALQVDLTGRQPTGTLTIGRLELGNGLGTLHDLRLHCSSLHLSNRRLSCKGGRLTAEAPFLPPGPVPVRFDYRVDSQTLQLTLPRLALSFNSADGNRAAQGLILSLHLNAQRAAQGWQVSGHLQAAAGQVYVDPVFVDFGKHPATLAFAGRVDGNNLHLTRLRLRQPGVVRASASLHWRGGLRALTADIEQATLPAAYESYLQPFVIGTPLARLTTAGAIQAQIKWGADGLQRLAVRGHDLDLVDQDGRFALHGLRVDSQWRRDTPLAQMPVSQLQWASAAVYRIPLGATSLRWRMAGDALALAAPARLPLLGGALNVARASGKNLTGAKPQVVFEAQLTPIRLAGLSQAFGWPAFGGTLSGDLPRMQYRDGTLTMDGGLTAQVFGGKVSIDKLRLAQPFGSRPRLRADAHARGLHLKEVTRAFSFGRITGRLDADVTGLRMLGWQPVAFDAWLRTPVDDHSRHRISQRAINNVAQLGGGGSALLSRGFLRLFSDFSYDRIGLGCRLRRGVCRMRGLGPAENGGFTIVRGAWLPRVDVIGYNRAVSYPVLVQQLKSVNESNGPVVNPEQPPDSER